MLNVLEKYQRQDFKPAANQRSQDIDLTQTAHPATKLQFSSNRNNVILFRNNWHAGQPSF
jgi:hypothetical protein